MDSSLPARESLVVEPRSPDDANGRPLVEIGWIVTGRLEPADEQAAEQARVNLLQYLGAVLPQFGWRLPLISHEELAQGLREEPTRLFDVGALERDIRRWDFAIIITGADLVSHEKPFSFAAFSTALGVATISTSRIDPSAGGGTAPDPMRVAVMARRVETLALHCLGHLSGVDHDDEPSNCMYDFQNITDLDEDQRYNDAQLKEMAESLLEVSDRRLEENPRYQLVSPWSFYARGAWVNRHDIGRALLRSKPWLFPIRLSRLATAAISAMLILIMTGESWELGMSLRPGIVLCVAVLAMTVTTFYVVKRQGLLIRRAQRGVREQKVVANLSVVLVVALGLLTTFLVLLSFTLAVCLMLFRRSVVEHWAGSVDEIGMMQYLCLAAYISSVGLIIGSLGASFEDQQYFRHVTFVDEEV